MRTASRMNRKPIKKKAPLEKSSAVKSNDWIRIRGARENNLKNINLDIPRNKIVVISGLSGSGKSSLAFDTIYAEGQRRYLESLSSYARQFLEKLKKPEIDYISGLSPSIAIEQRQISHNPRSTVATVTEIYDYLRLLFAKAGDVHCYQCGKPLAAKSPAEIAEEVQRDFSNKEVRVFAPLVRGRKGEFQKIFAEVLKKGYSKARIDKKMVALRADLKLRKTQRHDIEILIDHLAVTPSNLILLEESLERARELAEGTVVVEPAVENSKPRLYSTRQSCADCSISVPELVPNMFSFNSPYGACPRCRGLGKISQIEKSGLIKDPSKSLLGGALNEEIFFSFNKYFIEELLHDLTKKFNFEWNTPYREWPEDAREAFFWGGQDISGLIEELERLFHETSSEEVRRKVRQFLREDVCADCQGKRLNKIALGIKLQGKNIADLTGLAIEDAGPFFEALCFEPKRTPLTAPVLKEIRERLRFLADVGLGYLTLDRTVATLAGGELQRIRLAAQISVGLTGVLYVLDEPSIGLHPRDNDRLLATLEKMRDMGNTVIVVEHDDETMRRADYFIDIGPGAGVHGGQVVAAGPVQDLKKFAENSLTARYVTGEIKVSVPHEVKDYRRAQSLVLKGCREHNLKNVTAKFPTGLLTCVTGVSGSGKSTLIHDILYRVLHNRIWKTDYAEGRHKSLDNAELIDKVLEIDQSPIGRTPRSNPATYTDLFSFIRKLFSEMTESKVRRYNASRFSFNLKGGRCEKCRGEGVEKLEMSFMPDMYVLCDDCRGRRYNEATLEVRYKGKNIAEVLEMSVEEALEFFSGFSQLCEKLDLLKTIGLGYLKLGQPSTTLSGGEAQRVKLASELSKRSTGRTLYLLDEPTTGLHFADIENLLKALFQLRDQGNTIIVIEHNLDVVKSADYILDMGPEGGAGGGQLIASGTPSEIARCPESYTGKYLKKVLD